MCLALGLCLLRQCDSVDSVTGAQETNIKPGSL